MTQPLDPEPSAALAEAIRELKGTIIQLHLGPITFGNSNWLDAGINRLIAVVTAQHSQEIDQWKVLAHEHGAEAHQLAADVVAAEATLAQQDAEVARLTKNLAELIKAEEVYRANERLAFEGLSQALTGGNAGTWEEVIHAAKQTTEAQLAQALPPLRTWQPIETAPKDGTWILAWLDDFRMDVVRWDTDSSDNYSKWRDAELYPYSPTHWMPLPLPPLREHDQTTDTARHRWELTEPLEPLVLTEAQREDGEP